MNENAFDSCPKCSQELTRGFTSRGNSLPFAESTKIGKFFHGEEELSGAGWRTFLPHKAEYYQSFLCRDCQVYIVDYSTTYSKKAARNLHREHVSVGH
jgi:hypothetical protein